MMAHDAESGNSLSPASLASLAASLPDLARQAAEDGLAAHQAELAIFKAVLALGKEAFALFLRLQGTGDLGEQVALPDGSQVSRLEEPHERPYRSVFGDFSIPRTCYGKGERRKILFVPLDARLQLPQGDYSYLLQQWDMLLGSDCAWGRVAATLEAILGIEQPVDSLERMCRHMAQSAEAFRRQRPLPKAKEEGEVFVVSADGKGIPMRKGPDDPPPKARRGKGDKANKKRMAIVGAVYSVDRHARTPEDVVAALFRDPRLPGQAQDKRPVPVGKHLWARLSQAEDGSLAEPMKAVFGWLAKEVGKRNRKGKKGRKEVVCVMDGQEALWEGKTRHFGEEVVEILDLLHVTPRLWQAAHLFEKEGTPQAAAFVRERLLRVLRGESKGVVMGLRRLGTVRGLCGRKKKQLGTICRYLKNNEARMRYHEYLQKGYPVASGVIEGACRHYVKDRMERSGMRWTREGAQAMLDVRSECLNGDWQAFQAFRIKRETQRLYPHRSILDSVSWTLAA